MEKRSWISKIFGRKPEATNVYRYETIATESVGFWTKNLYNNDIVRSCIWPIANNAGRLRPVHIRDDGNITRNPNPSIRMLLEEPNPYMSMQDFIMKMVTQREKYNNAFAYLKKDADGNAIEIYPIPFNSVSLKQTDSGDVIATFNFRTGEKMTVFYDELIHLRKHFDENELFGDSNDAILNTIVDVVNTTDIGIVKAVKNSAVIRWILKFKQVLRPEDIDINVEKFTQRYLDIESAGGAVASDPKYDIEQVKPESYVPNAASMDRAKIRIQNFFGVSDSVIQNKYTEDEWNAFYESVIEPIAVQLSSWFTRKLFTARERGFGNKIIFEANSLQYASMSTKLGLVSMVDRGAMLPNEWRRVLNLGPIEGGDKPIRRLDTREIGEVKTEDEEGDKNA